MKVSIIIPCFNLGQYLEDAISSVEAQIFTDWEIIVVDDGSTEKDSITALKKIEAKKTHKVIRQKNSGPAAARNTGIKKAKGNYIVCLDADDMLVPTYLEKTVQIADKSEDKVAFVTTWLQEFGVRVNIWESLDYDVAEMLVTNRVHAGSLFKKQAWEKVGGYKETRKLQGYEDWEFWISLLEEGYKWAVIKEPLFLYRIRENSLLSNARSDHVEKYSLIYGLHENFFKHYSKDLVFENTKELTELHEVIREKNQTITELDDYRDEVLSLREEIFSLKDEINTMRNSRVLGKVIKTREFVGESRKKVTNLPHSAVHTTRVVVAPFIPRKVRKSIKKAVERTITVSVQANKSWPTGQPLVSVVIPYYNRADTIDDTIVSLKSQTFNNFETIIIDDGSTDLESIKKFAELKKSTLKASFISQKNSGVAVARNNGINHAKGKYIICLDSDDVLEPTYIEKATIALEANPDISIVTAHMTMFGVLTNEYEHVDYNPEQIIRNNMIITAAEYEKRAWEASGGYKSGIGYEDWEFWVNLSERGFWAKLIPEPLFRYRTSMQSRYVDDKDVHWNNMKSIQKLHPQYKHNIRKLVAQRQTVKNITKPATAFMNLNNVNHYHQLENYKPSILIIVPWLTFGGAETLILNFTNEIKDDYSLTFITGLESEHEWAYKFKEITDRIYHLTNLFEEPDLYLEFVSNYIKTRKIDAIHIIHTDYAFPMLPELKRRHPKLKVLVTLFNDRAAHFSKSLEVQNSIDAFSSDNNSVYEHYRQELGQEADLRVIPNAINASDTYNPILYDREKERDSLDLNKDDLAVFFIGRISEEKNPDVFLEAASKIVSKYPNIKFFVIGDGPMTPQVKNQVKSINNPHVQYMGYKSEVASYLCAADIFVLPSSIEGFPLSILEAMAMRVAVIASDVGAVSEVIDDGHDGFVVTPSSADEIVATIDKLRSDGDLLERIKKNARLSVEKKYSNKILGANYRKLYRDLLK